MKIQITAVALVSFLLCSCSEEGTTTDEAGSQQTPAVCAVNIDFKAPNFDEELAKLDHDKTYLVHCGSGGRSGMSLAKFREQGFKKILHLNQGFMEWEAAGLPVEK